MNKKGFTLIELLAVIVLLTLVGVFTVSTILDKNDEKSNKIDETTEKILKTAAQSYVAKNSHLFTHKSGNVYCLSVENILASEEVDNINANSKVALSNTKTYVKVTFLQNNVKYDVVTECVINNQTLPNDPVLASNMIPIKWDANNNIVLADLANPDDWYNYDERRWANALIVPRDLLSKFKGLKPGQLIIPFNEIVDEVIFVVWVPSYKYTPVTNGNKVTTHLTFGASSTPHKAFEGISGFWVSKFELTTLNPQLSENSSLINSSYSQESYKDTYSNLSAKINELYDSNYGFLRNEVELKMIDNDEWGAISYLTHSTYGILSEKLFAADIYSGTIANFSIKEVSSNNNYEATRLNYGLDHFANYTNEIYYSESSVFSSSTRNVTGVYGLNGGTNEWVNNVNVNVNQHDDALNFSFGPYDSYKGNYDPTLCLTRGGGTSNNGLFAYDSQPCSKKNTTRLVINVK